MKKTTAAIALLMILCMVTPALAQVTAAPWTFPLSDEVIHVTAYGLQSPQGGDHNDMAAWTKYEEMTNIDIDWVNVPTDVMDERLSILVASDELPDMIWACGGYFNSNKLTQYGSSGLFMDLTDLYNKYCYNLQNIVEQYPSVLKGITMGDGRIYALPMLKIGENMNCNKVFINPDWLKNVGMEMPTNFEEFNKVLYAFKEQDANGNGYASDEIPWIIRYSDFHFLPALYTFFGLGNRGTGHRYVDWDEEKNALRFIPTSPQFKDLLTWANKLYVDGILDPETFSNTSSKQIVSKTSQNIVGAHTDFVTNTGSVMQEVFRAIPVMENYYGDKLYTRVGNMIDTSGAFIISADSPYAEQLIKWCDYWYSEEGQLMWNMGVEGVTYNKNADGTVSFTDEMIHNPEGLTLTQVRVKYMGFQSGAGIQSDKYYQGAETYWTATELMDNYREFMIKDVWERFTPTVEEAEEMDYYWTDIKAYLDENIAAFISGSRPLTNWDNYVNDLNAMGLDKYMALYDAQYQRYVAA